MKEQNLKELLIDLKDFMDQVQAPATPALFLKRDINTNGFRNNIQRN